MDNLRGRNALLTGAAGGLGAFIARALAGEGVNLVLTDLPSTDLDPLAAELSSKGVEVTVVQSDLSVSEGRAGFFNRAEQSIGPIDILVNNAGLEFGGEFVEADPAELELITAVNLTAVMELTRQALPAMLERRTGHVVSMASMAGKAPAPFLATYAATKHGVVGFTHSLRAEMGSNPIGFSAICPTFITRAGMYGRIEHLVETPPPDAMTMPPEAVGDAVVKAILEDKAEIKVAKGPVAALSGVYAAAPGFVAGMFHRRKGAREDAQRLADARKRLEES